MSTILVLLFLVSSCLFIPSYTQIQQLESTNNEAAFVTIKLSEKGLDFVKSVAISKALQAITPITLPQIETTVEIPLLGDADVVLSRISITQIAYGSNCCNKSCIDLTAWGEVCNLTIIFSYPFSNRISDSRCVSIWVDGIQLRHRLDLQLHNGKPKLVLSDYSYTEDHVSVHSNDEERSNWLFHWMGYVFERQIGALLQNAISTKLGEPIAKFDSYLQALPNEIPIDESSSLNVTVLNGVSVDNSYIFDVNGLLISRNRSRVSAYGFRNPKLPVFCSKSSKQIDISIDEDVLNSAASLYFNEKYMQSMVDDLPDSKLQSTAGWSSILQQLHRDYPNCEVKLNISLASPPVIRISEQKIDATAKAELIINVLKSDKRIPVACFSLEMNMLGTIEIIEDEFPGMLIIGGNVKLNGLSGSLEWTNIESLDHHLHLIQNFVESVLVPYANAKLRQGFRIPGFHGFDYSFDLWRAEIILSNSKVTLCADLFYSEQQ